MKKILSFLLLVMFGMAIHAETDYNVHLYSSATGSYSMTTVGSRVTKKIGFYIQNNGEKTITLTKVSVIKSSTGALVTSSSDAGVLGSLSMNEKKTLSFTINEDANIYSFHYIWTYTIDGEEFSFDSRDSKMLVKDFSFDKSSAMVEIESSVRIVPTFNPSNATVKTLDWKSSDESIAKVEDGIVTGISEGTAIITATTTDGTNLSQTCTITVIGKIIKVSSVTLNYQKLEIIKGESETILATILPTEATNTSLEWESSNKSVASVENGIVTAVSVGKAIITAKATDGSGISATCEIVVSSNEDEICNGYEYVDLGLPDGLLWATYNVGATSPEGKGDFYAWGETSVKSSYTESNYKFKSSSIGYTKYEVSIISSKKDNCTVLLAQDDAATVNWGKPWRMPTDSEFASLRNNCTWTKKTINGVSGFEITGKNGNSIFLPVTGESQNTSVYSTSNAKYWSSSLYIEPSTFGISTQTDSKNAIGINGSSQDKSYRYYGRAIRPVVSANDLPTGIINVTDVQNTQKNPYKKSIKNGRLVITDGTNTYNLNGTILKTTK